MRAGRPTHARRAISAVVSTWVTAISASTRATLLRDTRTDEDYYELIGDDNGVFGCMSLLGCHDVCPKQLPLSTQIAFVRRKMVAMAFK